MREIMKSALQVCCDTCEKVKSATADSEICVYGAIFQSLSRVLLCDRWRGTPETPSSASCTLRCPSPPQRTLLYPAPLPRPATLQHLPRPPTQLRLRGTSPNPASLSPNLQILTRKPNTRQSKQSNKAKFYCAFVFYHQHDSLSLFKVVL